MKIISRLLLPLALLMPPLRATTIDVTGDAYAGLLHNARLSAGFGVWNYAANNPDYSPHPTQFSVQILGPVPLGTGELRVPGSSAFYYSGYLFTGAITSLDGSVSVPLIDPQAGALLLPPGQLLLRRGTVETGDGSWQDVAVIEALFSATLAEAEALFGGNIGNYDSAARIALRNHGEAFTLGLGPGYTVRNSIVVTGVGGLGPVSTAGITGTVTVTENPEPGTWALLGGGLLALGCARRRRSRLKREGGRNGAVSSPPAAV